MNTVVALLLNARVVMADIVTESASTPSGGALFPIDTIISLTVAILTLIATILIAVFTYLLQKRDTKTTATKQETGAKKILYTELSNGLEAVIRAPWSGGVGEMSGQLSTLLIAYLPSIQESFEPEQLHHLLQLVDVLTNTAKRAVSEDSAAAADYMQGWLCLFIDERFIPAMNSQYSEQFFRIDDYRRVLTPLTRAVLEILSGESQPPAAGNRLTALDGTPLLEIAPNGYTKIYNIAGEPLCNALLDLDAVGGLGIEAGWAKTAHYVGEFKDGLRHGQGCSYSLWGHHKLFEGKWENDTPHTGTRFNIVYEKNPIDGEYKELFPYWDDCTRSHHVTDYLTRRDGLVPNQVLAELYISEEVWVNDDQSFYTAETLRPLSDFMEEHDPKRLLEIRKLNNLFECDVEGDPLE